MGFQFVHLCKSWRTWMTVNGQNEYTITSNWKQFAGVQCLAHVSPIWLYFTSNWEVVMCLSHIFQLIICQQTTTGESQLMDSVSRFSGKLSTSVIGTFAWIRPHVWWQNPIRAQSDQTWKGRISTGPVSSATLLFIVCHWHIRQSHINYNKLNGSTHTLNNGHIHRLAGYPTELLKTQLNGILKNSLMADVFPVINQCFIHIIGSQHHQYIISPPRTPDGTDVTNYVDLQTLRVGSIWKILDSILKILNWYCKWWNKTQ